ncbi:MAG TPA: hypothetical protein VN428_05095 [Bryobacteraceae bacterium]|nr:hypothetical protein [Bryobacteraceae bacterium]
MCQSATNALSAARSDWARGLAVLAALVVSLGSSHAQTPRARPEWRRIGNGAVDAPLASPGSGAVDRVWYAQDGARLFARTAGGRVWETTDFQSWKPSTATAPASPTVAEAPDRLPEGATAIKRHPSEPNRLYAFGAQLLRSDDGGVNWTNLTAYHRESIIGGGMQDVAISPRNPEEVVVANENGLWRSADGGLCWTGLNESLPNLPVQRFAGLPQTTRGVRIETAGYGVAEWMPGEKRAWRPVGPVSEDAELRRALSGTLGAAVTAATAESDFVYAGSDDGRLWASPDHGRTWTMTAPTERGTVSALFADRREPRVALATFASARGQRVLRTVNGGQYWDDLTTDLPAGAVHGITADPRSGTVYAATDSGLYLTHADLNAPAPGGTWSAVEGLPEGRVLDVRLDPDGNQLFVALEGEGVYAAMAPHRFLSPGIVNAADFSTRPAAPGSLLSVLGSRVTGARAGDLVFPVLAASDAESQIQVPFNATGPALSLALETARGRLSLSIPVGPVSPAIFIDRDGTPLVLNADDGVLLDGMNPARSNARIQVLATGLGAVRPEWPVGRPGPLENPPQVVVPVRAYLDRSPIEVTRAVLAPGYVGLYLIEIQLPAIVNTGAAELYLEAEGQASNRVRITIEP